MTKKSHGCSSGVIPLCGVFLKAMIICDRRLFLLRITVLISAWEQVKFFVRHSPFIAGSVTVLVNACQSSQKRSRYMCLQNNMPRRGTEEGKMKTNKRTLSPSTETQFSQAWDILGIDAVPMWVRSCSRFLPVQRQFFFYTVACLCATNSV